MAAYYTNNNSELRRVTKGLNQGRKVRVVAKIKSLTSQEADGDSATSWIFVNKQPEGVASDSVTISFGGDQAASRKESYELDYCYEQNEDTKSIFTREVKSLIPGVFEGCNATVIACGARGSGKTSVIQGSIEKPGLASLAMDEFLLMAKEAQKSVSIAFYEVYLDQVYDLLDSKRSAVSVLDDGQGKIKLKGLSQIPVNSISEFHELYYSGSSYSKQGQKVAAEPPHRSHRGLIVHISSAGEKLDTRFAAKMNFVDMAGYEDARRKSSEGISVVENSKINKSIYALLNVASALNANESHVPYRESKLTHILQDSLGGQSKILMITCLNAAFRQESIYMASLAARSCHVTKPVVSDASNKNKSLTKSVMHSSVRKQIPRSVSATVKKQATTKFFSEKKAHVNTASVVVKGRKLFDDTRSSRKLHTPSALKHGEPTPAVDQGSLLPSASKRQESAPSLKQQIYEVMINSALEKDVFTDNQNSVSIDDNIKVISSTGDDQIIDEESTAAVKSRTSVSVVKSSDLGKENHSSIIKEDTSPPISARLRELSNSLRLLCASTPLCLDNIPNSDAPLVTPDLVEPRTPVMEQSTRGCDEWDVAALKTPWEIFSKSSAGVKKSVVEDYLRFLNTANKEELKKLKGIGDKRATYIIELREESPEPFKSLEDLMDIGLSAKQVKELIKKEVGGIFN